MVVWGGRGGWGGPGCGFEGVRVFHHQISDWSVRPPGGGDFMGEGVFFGGVRGGEGGLGGGGWAIDGDVWKEWLEVF